MIPNGFALAPAAIHRIKPLARSDATLGGDLISMAWLADCHWNHEHSFRTGSSLSRYCGKFVGPLPQKGVDRINQRTENLGPP